MKDSVENEELVLDTSGTECPIPVLKARKLASELNKDTAVSYTHLTLPTRLLV